jgi:hypothetical protein
MLPRHFKVQVQWSSRDAKDTRVIKAQARVCSATFNVPQREVTLGDCNVGQEKVRCDRCCLE